MQGPLMRSDMLNHIMSLEGEFPASDKIFRYLHICAKFPINTMFIGQSPYPSKLVPYFGSAFSQEKGARDTPSTQFFGRHFEDRDLATDMIRNNRLMLEERYFFVNADYYSQSLVGGINNVEYLERLKMMCEYLVSIIICESGNSRVGTDDTYTFCEDSALVCFRGMIEVYHSKCAPKASLIFSIIMGRGKKY